MSRSTESRTRASGIAGSRTASARTGSAHTGSARAGGSRHRAGAVLGIAAALALTACGSPQSPPSSAPSTPATTAAATPTGDGPVVRIAGAGEVFSTPLDAVPASDGSATWFTATGPNGPGVFATIGGNTAPLTTGAPFRTPSGLALTTDETTLLVADPEADAVFEVPVAGGAPAVVTGTRGLQPRGVEVAGDQLYVTGRDPATDTGAVFALPVAGGSPRTVATGLADPDGVTIAPDGAVLVTARPGAVLRLTGGTVQHLADGVRLGSPAGITLNADGTAVLISSLNPTTGGAQVLALDPVTGRSLGVFDEVIGANQAAGGLHMAHGGDTAAWADSSAPDRGGSVYLVGTRNLTLH